MQTQAIKRSFVFGNGQTRLNIDFDEVRPYGPIYACNAVYREYRPDHLIAVDRKMLDEICKSDYHLKNPVWTYNLTYKHSYKQLNFFEDPLGWSSGPSALYLANLHKPNEIYFFGFDFEGLNGKLNNIFANTENYKRSTDPATYHLNWLKQTESIIQKNPSTKFYRVTIPNFYETRFKYDNYFQIYYNNFKTLLSEWQKIR